MEMGLPPRRGEVAAAGVEALALAAWLSPAPCARRRRRARQTPTPPTSPLVAERGGHEIAWEGEHKRGGWNCTTHTAERRGRSHSEATSHPVLVALSRSPPSSADSMQRIARPRRCRCRLCCCRFELAMSVEWGAAARQATETDAAPRAASCEVSSCAPRSVAYHTPSLTRHQHDHLCVGAGSDADSAAWVADNTTVPPRSHGLQWSDAASFPFLLSGSSSLLFWLLPPRLCGAVLFSPSHCI